MTAMSLRCFLRWTPSLCSKFCHGTWQQIYICAYVHLPQLQLPSSVNARASSGVFLIRFLVCVNDAVAASSSSCLVDVYPGAYLAIESRSYGQEDQLKRKHMQRDIVFVALRVYLPMVGSVGPSFPPATYLLYIPCYPDCNTWTHVGGVL